MTKRFPKKRSKAQAKRNVKKKMTVTSTEPTSADDRESEPEDLGDVADGNSEDASYLGMSAALADPGLDEEDEASEKKYARTLIMEHNRKKKKSGGFQSMGLSSAVFNAVIRKGYKIPTPIQRKTVPLIMDGKDVVAMARTGSGKTAAFLIPMFERLRTHVPSGVRALIMSPTRELALQTLKFTKELGRFTRLKSAVILGGDRMEDQFAAIHENPDIVIATPGRFMHVLVEMGMKLSQVEYVVFDEADRLFEMGFQEQLMEIIKRLPDSRQTLLFSATLPKLLVEFAKAGLHDPTLIRLDVDTKLSEQLKLVFLECRTEEKTAILLYLLRTLIEPDQQSVIFVATKHHVEYLNMVLKQAGITCSCSYSSLDQTARKINVAKFRNKTTSVLVVTDLAARGIDIPMLDNVINFNFPAKPKLFVHRVGRVARAGRMGTAFSLIGPDEVPFVLDLHLFLGRPMNLVVPGKVYNEGTDVDALYGRVPWSLMDTEEENLRMWVENIDLKNQKRVADNAYKHYTRSRPAAASESVKRVKELADVGIGYHPVFQEQQDIAEAERLKLLDSMKHYRPPTTIFEINKTNKTEVFSIMKRKRSRHSDAIHATSIRRQKRRTDAISDADDLTHSNAQMSTESDMLGVFSAVVAPKPPTTDKVFQTKSSRKRGRDEENYVSYRPKDFNSEKGWAWRVVPVLEGWAWRMVSELEGWAWRVVSVLEGWAWQVVSVLEGWAWRVVPVLEESAWRVVSELEGWAWQVVSVLEG
ncbi:ATP-dependent RNA helicase DDX54 [Lamellibrachia satsuma]|nr:ATP-dependent RNA helicase DDX54 [Lamellibrachia satsuma]